MLRIKPKKLASTSKLNSKSTAQTTHNGRVTEPLNSSCQEAPSAATDIPLRLNRNSYYDRSGGNWSQSESLLRARRPYLFKNIALGAGLFAFTGAICALIPTLRAMTTIKELPTLDSLLT